MVFIVVKKEVKDAVMKAVYDEAGIDTTGQGILFSLPISEAVGLDPIVKAEEEKDEENIKK